MKKVTVNSGRSDAQFEIAKYEAKYNALFVGQFALKTKDGGWSGDSCGEVYYQDKPPVEGYSHYFALIHQNGMSYITSGHSAVEGIITGIVADDGEIIYSRFRHDYRESTDGSVFIDGGRDYVKCNFGNRTVGLRVIDGEFYQLEEGDSDDESLNTGQADATAPVVGGIDESDENSSGTLNLETVFKKFADEFLKFENVVNPVHSRPDICAFIVLDKLAPGKRDMVMAAEHDEIWLDVEVEELAAVATEEDILLLVRCGVRLDNNGLCMFV